MLQAFPSCSDIPHAQCKNFRFDQYEGPQFGAIGKIPLLPLAKVGFRVRACAIVRFHLISHEPLAELQLHAHNGRGRFVNPLALGIGTTANKSTQRRSEEKIRKWKKKKEHRQMECEVSKDYGIMFVWQIFMRQLDHEISVQTGNIR